MTADRNVARRNHESVWPQKFQEDYAEWRRTHKFTHVTQPVCISVYFRYALHLQNVSVLPANLEDMGESSVDDAADGDDSDVMIVEEFSAPAQPSEKPTYIKQEGETRRYSKRRILQTGVLFGTHRSTRAVEEEDMDGEHLEHPSASGSDQGTPVVQYVCLMI